MSLRSIYRSNVIRQADLTDENLGKGRRIGFAVARFTVLLISMYLILVIHTVVYPTDADNRLIPVWYIAAASGCLYTFVADPTEQGPDG